LVELQRTGRIANVAGFQAEPLTSLANPSLLAKLVRQKSGYRPSLLFGHIKERPSVVRSISWPTPLQFLSDIAHPILVRSSIDLKNTTLYPRGTLHHDS
jgi:hypothetical protein